MHPFFINEVFNLSEFVAKRYDGITAFAPEFDIKSIINEYRKKESLRRTYLRRPDLLDNYNFSFEELKMLEEIKKEEVK